MPNLISIGTVELSEIHTIQHASNL